MAAWLVGWKGLEIRLWSWRADGTRVPSPVALQLQGGCAGLCAPEQPWRRAQLSDVVSHLSLWWRAVKPASPRVLGLGWGVCGAGPGPRCDQAASSFPGAASTCNLQCLFWGVLCFLRCCGGFPRGAGRSLGLGHGSAPTAPTQHCCVVGLGCSRGWCPRYGWFSTLISQLSLLVQVVRLNRAREPLWQTMDNLPTAPVWHGDAEGTAPGRARTAATSIISETRLMNRPSFGTAGRELKPLPSP